MLCHKRIHSKEKPVYPNSGVLTAYHNQRKPEHKHSSKAPVQPRINKKRGPSLSSEKENKRETEQYSDRWTKYCHPHPTPWNLQMSPNDKKKKRVETYRCDSV